MKHSKFVFSAFALLALSAAGAPRVANVKTRQDVARHVVVSYYLEGEPAVVTVSAETNAGNAVWVKLDNALLANVRGEANRVLQPGAYTLVWQPRETMPDVKLGPESFRFRVTAWATNAPPDYMVVDLSAENADCIRYYETSNDVPQGVTADVYKSTKLVMKRVHAAGVKWRMGLGDHKRETLTGDDATRAIACDAREVTLSRDYYCGIYPVTLAQAKAAGAASGNDSFQPYYLSYNSLRGTSLGSAWPVYDANGVFDEEASHRVDDGSQIAAFRNRTNLMLDLPTEAQWEYMCRAGTRTMYFWGKDDQVWDEAALSEMYEYGATNRHPTYGNKSSAPVGSFKPNPWGFYDVFGNCFEWCLDRASATGTTAGTVATPYDLAQTTDPVGPAGGECAYRVLRSVGYYGGHNSGASYSRNLPWSGVGVSGSRADLGVRLVCPCLAM